MEKKMKKTSNCSQMTAEQIRNLQVVNILPKNGKFATIVNVMEDSVWGPQVQVLESWNSTNDTNAQFTEVSWYKSSDIAYLGY
jgi:hypothetical protein